MSKNKKLLILNCCHSDIPLIKAAKELGFYVISTGNKPELIGHKYSDQYIKADYSNFDEILRICIEKDWKGFKSEWLKEEKPAQKKETKVDILKQQIHDLTSET